MVILGCPQLYRSCSASEALKLGLTELVGGGGGRRQRGWCLSVYERGCFWVCMRGVVVWVCMRGVVVWVCMRGVVVWVCTRGAGVWVCKRGAGVWVCKREVVV